MAYWDCARPLLLQVKISAGKEAYLNIFQLKTQNPVSTVNLKHRVSFTYHLLVLSQDEVVVTERYTENDTCDSFKTMDPLLSL